MGRSGYQRGPALGTLYLIHLDEDFSLGIDVYALLAAFFTNVAKLLSHVYYSSNKVIKLVLPK